MVGWISEEKKYRKIGDERYQVSWYQVKSAARNKDEIDMDSDLISMHSYFPAKALAVKAAKKAIAHDGNAFGDAQVRRQLVDWLSRSDGIAEWCNDGESEYMA